MSAVNSPYRRGADQGFLFGIYLSAMFITSVLANQLPLTGLLCMLLTAGVPFLIYRFLRRTYVEDNGTSQFSALWMQGIMIFLCGSLISSLVALVYLRWINPTYIADQLKGIVELYNNSGEEVLRQSADVASAMLANNAVPPAGTWVMGMFWMTVFCGSILSSVMVLIVRIVGVPRHKSDK